MYLIEFPKLVLGHKLYLTLIGLGIMYETQEA